MLLTCQKQGQQLNDFIHKLSCEAVLSGPEDKLNSYSSVRQGSNIPQFRMLSLNPSRGWPHSPSCSHSLGTGLHDHSAPGALQTFLLVCFSCKCELPVGIFILHSLMQARTKKCFPWIFVEWKWNGSWLARYSIWISLTALGFYYLWPILSVGG